MFFVKNGSFFFVIWVDICVFGSFWIFILMLILLSDFFNSVVIGFVVVDWLILKLNVVENLFGNLVVFR